MEGRAETVRAAVEEMSDALIGRDAGHIEDLWQTLYRGGFYRGGPILTSAISGIEQALWDIKGRRLGVPVYELLGGPVRDKMRVYAWIGGDDPAEAAAAALERMAEGYTAVKMNATGALEWIDSSLKVQEAVARLASVREAVGAGVGIGIDFHGRVHKSMAKTLVKELEPFQPMFYEEPVLSENNEALAEIARHTSVPLATGERMLYALGLQIASGRRAALTSFSPTSAMRAASGRHAKSRRWRKPMMWPSPRIARLARSHWRRPCSWTSARPMLLFRNKAWEFITIKGRICWIIW